MVLGKGVENSTDTGSLMLSAFIEKIKPSSLIFMAMLMACGMSKSTNDVSTDAVDAGAPPPGPKDGTDLGIVLTELNVGVDDWMNHEAINPPTDEEFLALSKEFGFPIDGGEGQDSGCEGAPPPPLSSSCSISYSDEDPAYDYYGYTAASCYNYYAFPGDTAGESDCYIKFRNYWPGGYYYYGVTNACAAAASGWYLGQINAYDTSTYVYLRLDSKWCNYSNCEDGFKIY